MKMSKGLLIDRQFLLDLICRMVNPNLFEIDLPIVLDSRTIQHVNVYAVVIVRSAVREHFALYPKTVVRWNHIELRLKKANI